MASANYSPGARSGPLPVVVNKVLLKELCSLVGISSEAAFVVQWQSWVALTEIVWPAKLKIFTLWTFTGKVG